jgi:hypothetical protein
MRGLVSVVVASFFGFLISFVLSPDPTGVVPIAVGLALTTALVPPLYFGLGGTV